MNQIPKDKSKSLNRLLIQVVNFDNQMHLNFYVKMLINPKPVVIAIIPSKREINFEMRAKKVVGE